MSSSNNLNVNEICHMTRFGSFPQKTFNRISCSNCYKLLYYVFAGSQFPLEHDEQGYLISLTNELIDPNTNEGMKQMSSMLHPIEFEKWRNCCKEAENCCSNMIETRSNFIETITTVPSVSGNGTSITKSPFCPSVWDGWSCHAKTPAGRTSIIKCPEHFIADTCNSILGEASFHCENNGQWFRNEHGEYADYSNCLQSLLSVKQRLINVNIICHSISLVFLILGLIIFFSYRQLKVNRIQLHKNFFLSLILHSFMQILWESVIMRENLTNSSLYIDANHPGCILTNVLLQYTRSTNYFWMFSESFYLHKLLISVFKEQSNLFIFYFFGWGVPFILCLVYSSLTFFLNNHSCWTKNIYLIYIMNAPNILTILLNFIFLINVIRVLYKKLTASNTNEPHQYRRAVRATLILVPLFGLHLILSPYVMCESAPGSQIHNLINRLVESLQGFMVALIYCFCNTEVTSLLKGTLLKFNLFKFLKKKSENYERTLVSSDYDKTTNNLLPDSNGTANNANHHDRVKQHVPLLMKKISTVNDSTQFALNRPNSDSYINSNSNNNNDETNLSTVL